MIMRKENIFEEKKTILYKSKCFQSSAPEQVGNVALLVNSMEEVRGRPGRPNSNVVSTVCLSVRISVRISVSLCADKEDHGDRGEVGDGMLNCGSH